MGNFISNMDQVGNTNEYGYGITWAEGLSTSLNGLSLFYGVVFEMNITKKLISILLSILFITLYYVLRQRDLKIYANNANTDLAPNIVYLSLSSLLFIFTFFIKSDANKASDAYIDEVSNRGALGMPKKKKWNN